MFSKTSTRASRSALSTRSGKLRQRSPECQPGHGLPLGKHLSDQLKVVARMIGARNALGTKRQVFLVSLGGFDLHDNLIENQPVLIGRSARR